MDSDVSVILADLQNGFVSHTRGSKGAFVIASGDVETRGAKKGHTISGCYNWMTSVAGKGCQSKSYTLV